MEDSAEAEGQYGGMLEAIGDDTCMIDARFLVERFLRIMLADDHGDLFSETRGEFLRQRQQGTETEDRNIAPIAQDPALAYL